MPDFFQATQQYLQKDLLNLWGAQIIFATSGNLYEPEMIKTKQNNNRSALAANIEVWESKQVHH